MEYKAIGAFLILSGVFIAIAEILSYWQVKVLDIIPLTISPILYLFGATIGIIPIISNPERFSNALWYWDVIALTNITVVVLLEFYFIILGFPSLFIFGIIWYILLIIILQVYIIKDIRFKSNEFMKSNEEKDDLNLLAMFTKPQRVTEEEVSVSKEKKICLICKGKLARKIYICPECSTFYCKKCSETISNLENACWVCETPFDKSKPVRLEEYKDDKIDIETEEVYKTKDSK
jgi:uncharacterized protein YpmB